MLLSLQLVNGSSQRSALKERSSAGKEGAAVVTAPRGVFVQSGRKGGAQKVRQGVVMETKIYPGGSGGLCVFRNRGI